MLNLVAGMVCGPLTEKGHRERERETEVETQRETKGQATDQVPLPLMKRTLTYTSNVNAEG